MTRILVAGFQHETNTFASNLADWAAFNTGEAYPAYVHGEGMRQQLSGMNMPAAGFMTEAQRYDWEVIPSVWAGATPSSYVTEDAFERIADRILQDIQREIAVGLDGIYLDLHGAAVGEHADDIEGELLERIRSLAGLQRPVVVSLDLHANVTQRMLALADALVAYRTYPHIDMAETGERAARLLHQRLHAGKRAATAWRRLPFLIPLNAQTTFMPPASLAYSALGILEAEHGCTLSFCMGFPASDFPECGPVVWGHGERADQAVQALFDAVKEPSQWRLHVMEAHEAVSRALLLAESTQKPVVIADTQDNPGAGGNSNTTGLLRELIRQGAGRRWPGRVALGLMYDPGAAAEAYAAGVGARLELSIGTAVPTFSGQLSDPPLKVSVVVRSLGDSVCELTGSMMTGVKIQLGRSAAVEVDGVLVALVSGKMQLLDRALLSAVGIEPESMKIIVVKSSNHFRADFSLIASDILVAKAAGPVAANPADLPWKNISPETRLNP